MENKASNLNALIGVCDTVKARYGYKIYTDKLPQGFEEPCFFVETISTNQRQIGFRRYERTQAFCIHYYPRESESINGECLEETDSANDECLEVAENLLFLLEYIEVGKNKTRGNMMKYNISGEVLNFYVNYNYHLLAEHDEPLMDNLTQKRGVKNGRQKRI